MRELQSKYVEPSDMAANDNTISLYKPASSPECTSMDDVIRPTHTKDTEKHIQSLQN